MKKFLLLILCLTLSLVSTAATSGTCGENLYWNLKYGVLTISGTGAMTNYSGESSWEVPWYDPFSTITQVVISEGVTSIGDYAFCGCSGLTSVTIGNSVTSIGSYAFCVCSSLTSITIPNSVTSIGASAFQGCSGLTSITIPNSVTSIGGAAFRSCSSLTSITIPNSVRSIGFAAFEYCRGLTSITIPNSVTSIGWGAFYECSVLTSVNITDLASWCNIDFGDHRANPTEYAHKLVLNGIEIKDLVIPEGVTAIKNYAFQGCSGLTSVTIPNSVTSIGGSAFEACTDLTSVNITDLASWCNISFGSYYANPTYYAHKLVLNGTEIKDLVIPEGFTEVRNYTFCGCSGLTSVTIPNSVTSIGSYAFSNCTGLTSVTIPNSVTSIGSYAFDYCYMLQEKFVNESNCQNNNYWGVVFCDEETLDGLLIKDNVVMICRPWAISVIVPKSVTSISNVAFRAHSALKTVKLEGMNTIMTAYSDFHFNIYAHTPSITHLNLLRQKYKYLYSIETESKTETTFFSSVPTGYTRARANFVNLMSGYDWTTKLGKNGKLIPVVGNSCAHMVEKAGTYTIYLYAKYKDSTNYLMDQIDVTTKDIESFIQNYRVTSSSITPDYSIAQELEDEGAADVRYNYMISGGAPMSGLEPNTEYSVFRNIHCDAFDKIFYDKVRTAPIVFTTAMAKVINVGNVIVAATTNVDEEEMNVGFEWRRQDWSELNPSNTASAPIYEGQMEGYIRNLYTGAQWKYRPYYKSNSGNYYYGEWMGFDPTNTSYFEPTVHTYGKIDVTGNTAVVKGYAMRGTDDILSQGFRYWMSVDANTRSMKAPSMNDIMTVEAKGQVMTAVLPGLEYETTYCYQAYVTTVEGTVEGEIRMFTTGDAPADISPIQINGTDEEKKIVGYYDINGRVLSSPTRGISIVRYTDGSSRCVMTR